MYYFFEGDDAEGTFTAVLLKFKAVCKVDIRGLVLDAVKGTGLALSTGIDSVLMSFIGSTATA